MPDQREVNTAFAIFTGFTCKVNLKKTASCPESLIRPRHRLSDPASDIGVVFGML